ncbi:uncharacterized protein KZ484_006861 [Pholidichthys leucotaenia]
MFLSTIVCLWFLLPDPIGCSENSTGFQAGSFRSEGASFPPAVVQFSIPKGHHVCLQCSNSSGSSDVIWTVRDRKVLVTRRGSYTTNEDRRSYLLLNDGSLCLLHLAESDGGRFRCNQQLVAELQVLTGSDFLVSTGRTLLLPCSGSSRPKQRWVHQREDGKREAVLTKFRNGTVVTPERDDSRLSFAYDGLQITDLQPEDGGKYVCNSVLQGRVTVVTAHLESTSIQTCSSVPTPTSAGTNTDVVERKKKEKKQPGNVLLLVAVVGLGLMIVLLTAVCVLVTGIKCRRKKTYRYEAAQRQEDTELQPRKTANRQRDCEVFESLPPMEETIHYASLGRQNWRERPSRTPPDQNHHSVVYSSIITKPTIR